MNTILHQQTGDLGRFYIPHATAEDQTLGLLEYAYKGSDRHTMVILHAEVHESLRGTGSGRQLVIAAVDWARAHDLKIIPLCPFAKSVFQRDPTLHDVLRTSLSGGGDSF